MEISENELRRLISECVEEALDRYMLLNEMSLCLKDYKARAVGLAPQIAENWCLIYFYKHYNIPTSYIRHWGIELCAHMDHLSSLNVKNGKEERVLYKVWNEYDFDKEPLSVYKRIRNKFQREGIDVKAYRKEIEETCTAFVKSTREIIYTIINDKGNLIEQYIDSIGDKRVEE